MIPFAAPNSVANFWMTGALSASVQMVSPTAPPTLGAAPEVAAPPADDDVAALAPAEPLLAAAALVELLAAAALVELPLAAGAAPFELPLLHADTMVRAATATTVPRSPDIRDSMKSSSGVRLRRDGRLTSRRNRPVAVTLGT
ncbi:hypothetical protein acdb102_13310 [Acidothermaceae bacterium B102]|nr:hypothetical protein acdb102_13310 [Acidothermaceae bacterium B102]